MRTLSFYKTILLGITFCSSLNVMSQPVFKAGAARVDVTPSYGTIINGDFLPMYAREIHDPLYAKALAFQKGNTRFVFVVVDCMAIDFNSINDAKLLIQKRTGLSPEEVMVSSTHAHSCGSTRGGAACPADLNYRLSIPNKIAIAAVLALKRLQPAKVAWGHINVPKYTSCRRWYMKPGFPMISPTGREDKVWMNPEPGSEYLDRPVSPTDPQVSYLAIKNLKGEWISIFANYSIHYAADIPQNTISADYFGQFDKALKLKLNTSKDFVGIMSNGTSGDVNTTDFRLERNYPKEPYGKSKLIGNDVADSVVFSVKNANWQTSPVFKHTYSTVKVGVRKLSKEMVEKSKELVAATDFRLVRNSDKASDDIKRLYALENVELNEYQPDYYNLPLQAIHIGQGTIGTLPGEYFSETGLKLKKSAPGKFYCSVGLANAEYGYVPPASQFELGGYETWLCTSSQMEIAAEEKITKALIKLVKSAQ
jgi:neutral ceramidase